MVNAVGFGDELPRDPRIPRPDGRARGQLLDAPVRAHQREVRGDVQDSGDQDHEQDATPQHLQGGADVVDQVVGEGLNAGPVASWN